MALHATVERVIIPPMVSQNILSFGLRVFSSYSLIHFCLISSFSCSLLRNVGYFCDSNWGGTHESKWTSYSCHLTSCGDGYTCDGKFCIANDGFSMSDGGVKLCCGGYDNNKASNASWRNIMNSGHFCRDYDHKLTDDKKAKLRNGEMLGDCACGAGAFYTHKWHKCTEGVSPK